MLYQVRRSPDDTRALNRYRDHPAGNVPKDAARLVLAPTLAGYVRRVPDVRSEVDINDHVIDIVQEAFDAGIRCGGTVPEDMIALPICPVLRWPRRNTLQWHRHSPIPTT